MPLLLQALGDILIILSSPEWALVTRNTSLLSNTRHIGAALSQGWSNGLLPSTPGLTLKAQDAAAQQQAPITLLTHAAASLQVAPLDACLLAVQSSMCPPATTQATTRTQTPSPTQAGPPGPPTHRPPPPRPT